MEKVERLKRELAYTGTVLKVYKDTVQVPNGNRAVWDYIHHDGAAAVVPVRDDGKILMVRQYRNALDRFTLELPAGKVDEPDEPRIECAKRELEEETGYRSDHLELLITVNTTVAFCDEQIEIYLAKDLTATKQNLDEDEEIDVEAYTLDELCGMIFRRELRDSKTVAGILAYQAKLQAENKG
ncbi:NUDIX hydrolase [Cuneatibacter sp. NSJ-177]|uniref:NUDIX domain-containing protein n=1 Tax=Cuneatibacter sp. NSJ-177 TaxID=2931401 RepID=UPI001FD27CD6|nr:NUDIX hydrolase [Cuneatibacter sp. NSJ-177]MCJ7835914.1 NUDIX hydrolase [Cuneatibacter sp. NSJ-177]